MPWLPPICSGGGAEARLVRRSEYRYRELDIARRIPPFHRAIVFLESPDRFPGAFPAPYFHVGLCFQSHYWLWSLCCDLSCARFSGTSPRLFQPPDWHDGFRNRGCHDLRGARRVCAFSEGRSTLRHCCGFCALRCSSLDALGHGTGVGVLGTLLASCLARVCDPSVHRSCRGYGSCRLSRGEPQLCLRAF